MKFLEKLLGRRNAENEPAPRAERKEQPGRRATDTSIDKRIDHAQSWSEDIERRMQAIDVDLQTYEDEQ